MTCSGFDSLFFDQLRRYPALTAQDIVKSLYQSVFGCGHFVGEAGRKYLADELASLVCANRAAFIEPIGHDYCRVHLSGLAQSGLAPDTLFSLFALSSLEPAGSMDTFLAGLARLEALIDSGTLPLNAAASREFLKKYRAAGCPAVHHSETFRAAYAPAYRVVSARMCRCLPVFCAMDRALAEDSALNVAIEGGSASGKTSLAALLEGVYDCNVFHMDDFFLQPHQRTPERFAQPGGNVDFERFEQEVLIPLAHGEAFTYRKFDCSTMSLGKAVSVTPKKLNITEGAYSLHPRLKDAYRISVFLDSDPETQRARILARNGAKMLERFTNEWIPLENRYFESTGVRERCDIILPPPEKQRS